MLKSNRYLSLSVISLIISCPHKDIPLRVEVPTTPKEKASGLMFRERLGLDEGMLFHYSKPQTLRFWMKNTLLPLDIIYSNKQGKIIAIYENTVPYSLDSIGPVANTTSVLEVNAGTVAKNNITRACTTIYTIPPKDLAR